MNLLIKLSIPFSSWQCAMHTYHNKACWLILLSDNVTEQSVMQSCFKSCLFLCSMDCGHITECAKTYVPLSGTGRNLVWTCKPLTWVHGTSTVSIRKKNRNSWKLTSNYSRIKIIIYLLVIKANLILDKINKVIKFILTSPFHGHFICFYELCLALEPGLSN